MTRPIIDGRTTHGKIALEAQGRARHYGGLKAVDGVSFQVRRGSIHAVIGPNGAGKTTALRTLMGALAPRSGTIRLDGRPIQGLPPEKIARVGMQLVPEERAIFEALTVEENLRVARLTAPKGWSLDRIWEVFPRLKERRTSRGRTLSGGEQQMLSIARALSRDPRILLLDEPFEGLAPLIVQDLIALTRRLAEEGRTIVVVEQNVAAVLSFAQRVYGFNNGHVVYEGSAADLRADPAPMRAFLGLTA